MENKDIRGIFLPLSPEIEIKPAELTSFTECRQKILLKLVYQEETLTQLASQIEDKGVASSTVLKALRRLEDDGFVEKTPNKTYRLTKKGKIISFIFFKPNGKTAEQFEEIYAKTLKEDLGISESLIKIIIEQCRGFSDAIAMKSDSEEPSL